MNKKWERTRDQICCYQARTGIILGSGLSPVVDRLTEKLVIPYSDIPGMPQSAVKGHHGTLVAGFLHQTPVVVMSGRIHAYEGYTARQVAHPVDILADCGISTLITTSAVGAVNPTYNVGDIMLVRDHINLISDNPLVGESAQEDRDLFVPVGNAYDRELRALFAANADTLGIPLRSGVLAAMLGPSYETAAEIRMLHILGADAIGMSVVFETIRALWYGMRVVGLSAITNQATGVGDVEHSHADVVKAGKTIAENMVKLLETTVQSPEMGL